MGKKILPDGPDVGNVADWIRDREARGIYDNITTEVTYHISVPNGNYENTYDKNFVEDQYARVYKYGYTDAIEDVKELIKTSKIPDLYDEVVAGNTNKVAMGWKEKKNCLSGVLAELAKRYKNNNHKK